mgnify:CR=1 FL=1
MGVVITRPAAAAQPLVQALEHHGARVFLFPALAIQPMEPPPASAQALAELARCTLAIFVSANDTQGDPGGIFKSTNNGDSFVAIGPDNVPVESIAVGSDRTIYVGTTGQGVWRLDPR